MLQRFSSIPLGSPKNPYNRTTRIRHDSSEALPEAMQASWIVSWAYLLVQCRYLIENALVAIVPGDAFGAPGCVRISYAASLEALQEALSRIQRALQPDVFFR